MAFSGPLSDRVEIRELYETYNDAIAMHDAELWGSAWAEDCAWNVAGHNAQGRANAVALWTQMMEGFSFVVFSAVLGALTIDNDKAKGRCHTVEELWDKEGKVTKLQGRYDDDIVRIGGRWVFKTRNYTILRQIPITVPGAA